MTVPSGEGLAEYDASLQRLQSVKRLAVELLRVAQSQKSKKKVIASAYPRKLFGIRLPHRTYPLLDQRVLEAVTPSVDMIRFGVSGSGEFVVKHPVARDVYGDAVLIRTKWGLSELRSTWQVISPNDIDPLILSSVASGLEYMLDHTG